MVDGSTVVVVGSDVALTPRNVPLAVIVELSSAEIVEVPFRFVDGVVLAVKLSCFALDVVNSICVELSRLFVSLNATSFVKTISGSCSKIAIKAFILLLVFFYYLVGFDLLSQGDFRALKSLLSFVFVFLQ